MEDRKRRFDDRSDVGARIAEVLEKLSAGDRVFDGVHAEHEDAGVVTTASAAAASDACFSDAEHEGAAPADPFAELRSNEGLTSAIELTTSAFGA